MLPPVSGFFLMLIDAYDAVSSKKTIILIDAAVRTSNLKG
jgi:hypothetical protein